MVVAKNDESHRQLARQFSSREVHKTYLALVQAGRNRSAARFRARSVGMRSAVFA